MIVSYKNDITGEEIYAIRYLEDRELHATHFNGGVKITIYKHGESKPVDMFFDDYGQIMQLSDER